MKNQPSKRASFERTARTQRSVSVCMVQASGTGRPGGWRKSDMDLARKSDVRSRGSHLRVRR